MLGTCRLELPLPKRPDSITTAATATVTSIEGGGRSLHFGPAASHHGLEDHPGVVAADAQPGIVAASAPLLTVFAWTSP